MQSQVYSSSETVRVTTREAGGAFTHGTMTMPPQEKNLQAVNGTLHELEKKIIFKEKEMQIQVKEIFSKKCRASTIWKLIHLRNGGKTTDSLPSTPRTTALKSSTENKRIFQQHGNRPCGRRKQGDGIMDTK